MGSSALDARLLLAAEHGDCLTVRRLLRPSRAPTRGPASTLAGALGPAPTRAPILGPDLSQVPASLLGAPGGLEQCLQGVRGDVGERDSLGAGDPGEHCGGVNVRDRLPLGESALSKAAKGRTCCTFYGTIAM